MTDRTGQCLCGAVSFAAREVRSGIGVCHCRMCQRWTGLALMAVTVPEDRMTVTGAGHVGTYASSDWASRSWCTRCGSTLWYRVTAEGAHRGDYEIPIGLFDDPSGFELKREIFIDRKPDTYAFAGDRERLTEAEVIAYLTTQSGGA
jgi:hypothetical protein